MKRVLLVPVWISAWFLLMPNHYRTVSWQKSEKGKRYALGPAVAKVVSIRVCDTLIVIGHDRYRINDAGTIKFSDSVYGYQCKSESGAGCAISIGNTDAERAAKYRIIIMWDDSMYLYKAN